jgi:regulatory protein
MNENSEILAKKAKKIRKITKQRLKNIALYYLKRFDSSVDNLRRVLKKKVYDYAYYESSFDKKETFDWIEELLEDFERMGYLDDRRYAEFKIKDYLLSGKSERYIQTKMQQKGISQELISSILSNKDYDVEKMAIRHAEKKKIGPYRNDEEARKNNRQKDLAALVRAGFDYDVACRVIGMEFDDEFA